MVILRRPPPAAVWLALLALSRPAGAQVEPIDCVLDSDCDRGRCVDLLCVDGAPRPGAIPAPAPVAPEPTGITPPPASSASPPPSPAPEASPAAATPGDSTSTPEAVEPTRPGKRKKKPRKKIAPGPTEVGRWDVSGPGGPGEPARPSAAGEPPPPERIWYGGPLLATYAVPPIALAVAIEGDEPGIVLASVLAAPIVHWANGQGGKGLLSLLMQPLSGGVGALLGAAACDSGCGDGAVVAGAVLGYVGWVALDVGVQAYKDAPRESQGLTIAPLRVAGSRGLEVSGAW